MTNPAAALPPGHNDHPSPNPNPRPMALVPLQSSGPKGNKRAGSPSVFTQSGGPKKQVRTDPLVHHGRHFGRAIRSYCRVQTLIKNGLMRSMQLDLDRITEAEFSPRYRDIAIQAHTGIHQLILPHSERIEHAVYKQLLGLSPELEERLCTGSEQDIFYVAQMISKGASGARSDDTKSLKAVVVDWITPAGGNLCPPIHRNVKSDRGFFHPRTGELLCPVNLDWSDVKIQRDLASGQLVPSGDLWPRFLYRANEYDAKKPWDGLFRSGILVSAYKHVFTSPSSVGNQNASRATRSSNARIHGMQAVTIPSIAYIATQVRFALSSASTFGRGDTASDSEYFYNLVIELLEDPEEVIEVNSLLLWWNRQIFPTYISKSRSLHQDSVISMIKSSRRELAASSRAPTDSVGAAANGGDSV